MELKYKIRIQWIRILVSSVMSLGVMSSSHDVDQLLSGQIMCNRLWQQ